jgi:branched-chain amino acid transport system ATP-binding protein
MTAESSPPAALSVALLHVAYGGTPAVRGVSLGVGRGEAVAVIGSNGAGKTSMLKGVMGLIPAKADAIEFEGQSVQGVPTHRLSRMGIGYVPEGRELFRGLAVEEELQLGGRLLARIDYEAKLGEVFRLFPRLEERRRQITRTLSGGEQQMLAIARTLMAGPRLLLLDEPSLGLAPVIQDAVYGTLNLLRCQGMSMLLVEQNAYRALKLCSRAYVLELGAITREAPSDDLINDPVIKAAYLGEH